MILSSYNDDQLAKPPAFCCPCGRHLGQVDAESGGAGGGAVTTTASARGLSPGKSIGLGVVTGVLIWLVTRTLDGRFARRG